ncbi:MAG: hypothetical protein WAK17_09075 [Candidatus Nitrosopolaris sp.]|jgi:hypothetical protein
MTLAITEGSFSEVRKNYYVTKNPPHILLFTESHEEKIASDTTRPHIASDMTVIIIHESMRSDFGNIVSFYYCVTKNPPHILIGLCGTKVTSDIVITTIYGSMGSFFGNIVSLMPVSYAQSLPTASVLTF